jgi:DNA-binding PadR family transcriptional regulator
LPLSKHSRRSKPSTNREIFPQSLRWPEKVPKGLLEFYILHLISEGQSNDDEIFQSLGEKTAGSWRPREDSINLALRKLAKDGLIRECSNSRGPSDRSERIYGITLKGKEFLREGKDVLANADQDWFTMRGIFIELMDATQLPRFLGEGSEANFQLSREIIQAKISKLNWREAELSLRDYALNLYRQLKWARAKLHELRRTNQSHGRDMQGMNAQS